MLHHLAIQTRGQIQLFTIGNFTASDQEGSKGTSAYKVFAGCELRGVALPVTHRAIVVSAITGDMLPGLIARNPSAALANHHGYFTFVVKMI